MEATQPSIVDANSEREIEIEVQSEIVFYEKETSIDDSE